MPLSTLAGQAVAMFVLSFAVGYLPLVFRKLQQGKAMTSAKSSLELTIDGLHFQANHSRSFPCSEWDFLLDQH